jgi:hypothetical protein
VEWRGGGDGAGRTGGAPRGVGGGCWRSSVSAPCPAVSVTPSSLSSFLIIPSTTLCLDAPSLPTALPTSSHPAPPPASSSTGGSRAWHRGQTEGEGWEGSSTSTSCSRPAESWTASVRVSNSSSAPPCSPSSAPPCGGRGDRSRAFAHPNACSSVRSWKGEGREPCEGGIG